MPPEHPTPGTDTAAAAARAEKAAAAPPPPAAAPAEETTQTPAPETEPTAPAPGKPTAAPPSAEAGTTGAKTAKAETAEAKTTEAETTEAETSEAKTAKPGTAEEPEAPPAGLAKATAIGTTTTPNTKTITAVDRGRPRTPILAGAVFVGAALVAIPVLLMGSANDEEPRNTATAPVAGSADTVLDAESAPAALDDYVAVKPTPSPSAEKPKKIEPPRAAAPKPAAPAPEPGTSAPPEKKSAPAPKPKPKPKAAPQTNWGTQTVSATSSIGVGRSWATNRIRLTMQQDGNLVVYNEQNKPIWAAMTFGENHRAIFQPDGNLVIHNGDDRPIWASKTHDFPGAQMVLRPDAKVVIVHNGKVVWST